MAGTSELRDDAFVYKASDVNSSALSGIAKRVNECMKSPSSWYFVNCMQDGENGSDAEEGTPTCVSHCGEQRILVADVSLTRRLGRDRSNHLLVFFVSFPQSIVRTLLLVSKHLIIFTLMT